MANLVSGNNDGVFNSDHSAVSSKTRHYILDEWTRSRFDMGRRDGRVVADPLHAGTDRVRAITFSIVDW